MRATQKTHRIGAERHISVELADAMAPKVARTVRMAVNCMVAVGIWKKLGIRKKTGVVEEGRTATGAKIKLKVALEKKKRV